MKNLENLYEGGGAYAGKIFSIVLGGGTAQALTEAMEQSGKYAWVIGILAGVVVNLMHLLLRQFFIERRDVIGEMNKMRTEQRSHYTGIIDRLEQRNKTSENQFNTAQSIIFELFRYLPGTIDNRQYLQRLHANETKAAHTTDADSGANP